MSLYLTAFFLKVLHFTWQSAPHRLPMIYVDESIQHQLGYICTAMVQFESDPSAQVACALQAAGLIPMEEEYKSGARMHGNPHLRALRDALADIVRNNGRVAILVTPSSERDALGRYIAQALAILIRVNGLSRNECLYLDQGIVLPRDSEVRELVSNGLKVHEGADSKKILGIQLADHAAYHCSYIIKAGLVGDRKTTRVGFDHGYPEEFDAELAWVLRTDLRHAFFKERKEWNDDDGDWNYMHRLLGYGAFMLGSLDATIESVVLKEFESIWMGCIH